LWLATGLVSALLVYWLHFKPVYDEDWTAAAGSVVCAGLALYAAVGCLNNLGAAFSGMGKPQRPLQR
jgi:4-amino-4-deoxy-L-arabinose transferase-like glycosyltransferase